MRKAAGPLLVVAFLVLAWSAAWLAASMLARQQIEGFIAAEARQGRTWTCPDRRIGGFPFALVLTCRDATFAGAAMGQSVEGQVAGLTAALSLAHPLRVAIDLASPFSYRSSDGGTAVGGSWTSLRVELTPLPDIRTLSLQGTEVAVHGRFPQQGEAGGSAATVAAVFTAAPVQPDPTLSFFVAMTGAPVPALDALVGGGAAPIDAAVTGTLDRADPGDARTPEQAMEVWRRSGGRVAISQLKLSRDGASVDASGTLALDPQHRPQGKLDASFVGLGPILKRYGISGDVAALGTLIGTLFGGGPPAKPAVPGALSLPVGLKDGRMSIGPITTGVTVSPLY